MPGVNQMSLGGFPVMGAPEGCAKYIDVSKLDREWAMRIHSQSLETLASRGGLSPKEIKLNLERGKLLAINS